MEPSGTYTPQVLKCDICGQVLHPNNTILLKSDNDIWLLVHYTCYDQYIGKCASCNNASCALATDHTLPQYVTQIVQQGNMRLQKQVLNPALVDKHCKTGCACWHNNRCEKTNSQSCENYKLIAHNSLENGE